MVDKTVAEAILQDLLGEQAQFREGQWGAISAVVNQRQNLVVVQRTGWGKSLVYFIATRLNRQLNRGLTVLISPLLSLMRNQIESATQFGLRAERIDSTNRDDHPTIIASLLRQEIDILLISPERLGNEAFRTNVWSHIRQDVGLLVVDEVHCISDWGHDFRPDYRRVLHILEELSSDTAILGTTATANTRVIEDVKIILGKDVQVSRGSLMRDSLQIYTYPDIQTTAYRLVLMAHLLRSIQGTGIIYCTTTRDCEIVARWLQNEGFAVEAYHSNVADREGLEQKLLQNQVKALVASVALGMGFDKPDLSFVVHFQLPGSIISYYQQIGRAGRGIDNAYIILMRGQEDREIQEYFIETAFPNVETMNAVARYFLTTGEVKRSEIELQFNLRQTTATKVLQHLEIEGFIEKVGSTYQRVRDSLPDFGRWAGITGQRYQELEQMETFARTQNCLMRFLADALEDPTYPQNCERCKNCKLWQSNFELNETEYQRAQKYLLEGDPIWINPRKQWARRNIITPKAKLIHLNEPGLSLSFYNDDGWGKRVKQGKYSDTYFDDQLVNASAELIRQHWTGQFKWVTSVPSPRRQSLVSDFARRLSQELNLPYVDSVVCVNPYPEQMTMQNSHLQLQNIADAFEVQATVKQSPVLLVDDIVDSGWSLTLVGWLLREQGVPQVFPFVLAKAMGKL